MEAESLLKNFAIDTWYKAVMVFGAILFVVSLFYSVKGLTNSQLQLLAGGSFLFALGEWKKHKTYSGIKPPNAYTGPAMVVEKTVRQPDSFATLLQLVGFCLIVLAIWRIVRGR